MEDEERYNYIPDELHRDLRSAFLRKHADIPNIEDEWQRLQAHTKRHFSWSAAGWGALAGIAASVLVAIVLLRWISPVAEEPYMLYTALEQTPDIEMSSVELAAPQPAQMPVVAKSSTTVQSSTLDFRSLTAAADGIEERTIRTPRSKDLTIILNDSTQVILNAESTLRFPTCFTGDTRTVYLEGEAYFTVAKNPDQPFIVQSLGVATQALGTQFNVKAYKAEEICVALIDGSVRVSDSADGESVILMPGQDVNCIDGRLIVSDIDTKVYRYWRDGFFYFDNVPLIDVMLELGRWYNINVEIKRRDLMSYRLHFVSSRSESIDDAIERLNDFSYLSASVLPDRIIIDEK